MDITDAAHLARTLMNEHGLDHVPFKWANGKTVLGTCHWGRDVHALGWGRPGPWEVDSISLSRPYVEVLPEAEVRNVILHEIAHALAGTPEANHGPVWRAHARRLGVVGNSCVDPSAHPDSKYTLKCKNGHAFPAHRKPTRVKGCSKCSRTFKFDYVMDLFEGSRKVPMDSMPVKYRAEYIRLQARAQSGLESFFV
jgi:hypothetical protein